MNLNSSTSPALSMLSPATTTPGWMAVGRCSGARFTAQVQKRYGPWNGETGPPRKVLGPWNANR